MDIRLLKKDTLCQIYSFSKEDFQRFVYEWNIANPIDRYYRRKHNLRFNSPEHRVCNFIDMAIEYYEDIIFNIEDKDEYMIGSGDFLKPQEQNDISDDELMKAFSDNDISKLDNAR